MFVFFAALQLLWWGRSAIWSGSEAVRPYKACQSFRVVSPLIARIQYSSTSFVCISASSPLRHSAIIRTICSNCFSSSVAGLLKLHTPRVLMIVRSFWAMVWQPVKKSSVQSAASYSAWPLLGPPKCVLEEAISEMSSVTSRNPFRHSIRT